MVALLLEVYTVSTVHE
jgi:hypothetical protein